MKVIVRVRMTVRDREIKSEGESGTHFRQSGLKIIVHIKSPSVGVSRIGLRLLCLAAAC